MRWLTRFLIVLVFGGAVDASDDPRWWKGNLHTHTLWSDGDEFPEVVAEWYKDRGYHFLALSDHNVLSQGDRWMPVVGVRERAKGEPWRGESFTPRDAVAGYLERFGHHWVETRLNPTNGQEQVRLKPLDEYRTRVEEAGRFLLIQAEEITTNATNGRAIHIGAVNIHEWIATQPGANVQEVMSRTLRVVADSAARAKRQVLIHVNHPNYKWGVTAEDLAAVVDEDFFEIWNGVDGDNDPGDALHPSTDEIWDIANTLRLAVFNAAPLRALATDDSHHYQGNKVRAKPGRAWVMVRSRFLTPEHLIRAMRAGDFYASTGVELDDVRFDAAEKTLSVRIRPKDDETFVTRFIGTRRGVNVVGRPRLGPDGKVIETSLDYRTEDGPRIGEVLAEVSGVEPKYRMTGDELYVRAVVTSTGAPEVPSTEFGFKRAWTQPVGWTVDPKPSGP